LILDSEAKSLRVDSIDTMGYAYPILSASTVSHTTDVIVYCVVFMVFSIIIVATRLFIRIKIVKYVGAEDYAIIVALVSWHSKYFHLK
jgi:hypothetical protein